MEVINDKTNIYNTEIKTYNDYIYKNSIVKGLMWDEEVVDEIINNIKDDQEIIDIGANIGLITLGVIKKAKELNKNINQINCFECDPKIVPLLTSNVSQFDNVKIYPFALSNKQEICHITTLEMNMGCNYIYRSNDATNITEYDYSKLFYTPAHKRNSNICILSISLDSIKYQFTNKIGLIKIDVEGYELKVLEGAIEIIQEHRPIIVTEVFESIHFNDLLAFFQKVKYSRYRKIPNKIYDNQDYIFYP